ncbi:MAG: cupin domain-containing protein [Gemmatimonadetes bacterium]|nr:cupin domain-containing protein [Gemmatimonadota bacterium]
MGLSRTGLLTACALLAAAPGAAQTPAPAEADPGVRPTRLIDRAEIRVSRVELGPSAVRAVHAHDDVEYHVWVPLEGRLEITIESGSPTVAEAGQAFFLMRGTSHGFRNLGTAPAAVMEIFVKQSNVGASLDAVQELNEVMALITMAERRTP